MYYKIIDVEKSEVYTPILSAFLPGFYLGFLPLFYTGFYPDRILFWLLEFKLVLGERQMLLTRCSYLSTSMVNN
jgi:hypothetical protein